MRHDVAVNASTRKMLVRLLPAIISMACCGIFQLHAGDGVLPTEVSPDAPFRIVGSTGGFNAAPGLLASTSSEGALVVTIDVSPTGFCVGDSLVLTINLSEVVIDAIADVFVRNVTTGEVFLVGTGDFSGDFSQVTGVFDQVGVFDAWVTIDGVKSNEVRLTSVGVDVSGPESLTIGETVRLEALAGPPGGTLTFVDLGGTGSVTLDPATGDVTGRLPGTVQIGATYSVAGITCDDPTSLEIIVPEPEGLSETLAVLANFTEDFGFSAGSRHISSAVRGSARVEEYVLEGDLVRAQSTLFGVVKKLDAFIHLVENGGRNSGRLTDDQVDTLVAAAEEAQQEAERAAQNKDNFSMDVPSDLFGGGRFEDGLGNVGRSEGGDVEFNYPPADRDDPPLRLDLPLLLQEDILGDEPGMVEVFGVRTAGEGQGTLVRVVVEIGESVDATKGKSEGSFSFRPVDQDDNLERDFRAIQALPDQDPPPRRWRRFG